MSFTMRNAATVAASNGICSQYYRLIESFQSIIPILSIDKQNETVAIVAIQEIWWYGGIHCLLEREMKEMKEI